MVMKMELMSFNCQGFEKMISGVYLGEIARLVFHKMAQVSDVFGTAVDGLAIPFTLRYLHTWNSFPLN